MKLDENEKRMRRVVRTLKQPSTEILPAGAPTCITCHGPPTMVFWRRAKFWTICCSCGGCDISGGFDTHALAIAAWSKRNARIL